VKGEDVSIPDNVIKKIFKLANLRKTDIFYDLGCGNNNTIAIAAKEFKVKMSIGIEIRKSLAIKAYKKIEGIKNAKILNGDIKTATFSDLCSAPNFSKCGNSFIHGAHQVAQKLTT
jgi:tRNA G46 methylase TrmB